MSPRAFQRRDFDELERRRMRGGPVAASRHQSGRGGTTGEGESGKCSSLGESNRAGGSLSGIEESGPRRTETAVEWEAVAAVGSDAARGSRESRVPERSMDPGAGGRCYPRAIRGGISFRPRVVDLAPETRLELPAAGRTSPRAKRGRHPRLERKHLAGP